MLFLSKSIVSNNGECPILVEFIAIEVLTLVKVPLSSIVNVLPEESYSIIILLTPSANVAPELIVKLPLILVVA